MPLSKKAKALNTNQLDSMSDNERLNELLRVAREGNLECIKYLKEKCEMNLNGVSEEEQQCQGLSALHTAVRHNQIDCVQYLVDSGADINVCDNFGFRPIHDAALLGHIECLNALLSKGAVTYGVKNSDYLTPLYYSLQQNRKDCVQSLHNKTSAINNEYWEMASKRDNVSVLDINRNESEVDKSVCSFDVWLKNAASNGNHRFLVRIKEYLARKFNSKEALRSVVTATVHDKIEYLKTLLEDGLDPNRQDEHKMSALHYAARYGHDEGIDVLLKHGADINIRNTENWTPLHVAIRQCCIEGVDKLLECGADVNEAGGPDNDSPIHIALRLPAEEEIMKRLLEAQPNLALQNKQGKTALQTKSEYTILNDLVLQYARN